jgi:hypothetical protein
LEWLCGSDEFPAEDCQSVTVVLGRYLFTTQCCINHIGHVTCIVPAFTQHIILNCDIPMIILGVHDQSGIFCDLSVVCNPGVGNLWSLRGVSYMNMNINDLSLNIPCMRIQI